MDLVFHGLSLPRNFAGYKLYVICTLLAVTEYEYDQPSKINTKCLKVEGDMSFCPFLKIGP